MVLYKNHRNEVDGLGKKNVNMLSGSIVKGLFAISIPIMIMNVVASLFNIIDMTVLKTYDPGNGIAVGAVGVCSSLINLFTVLVIGISTGSNVVIARNIGRKDMAAVSRATGTSLAFSIVSGLALAVIGVLGADVFLRMINCPEDLLEQGALYFRLYFASMPFLMVYNFSASILRSAGDTRHPMVFSTVGSLLKILLSYVMIAKFQMGVAGVGIATIVIRVINCTLCLRTVFRNQETIRVTARDIRFYRHEMLQILKIGVPTAIQRVLYSYANVLISSTVNSFGSAATTGISIANNYDGILSQICTAASLAVMPYVSQNVGAGNIKRAQQSVGKGILITVCLGGFFGALSGLFSTQLASIMSSDPLVITYARQKMVLISGCYFIHGINEIFGAALRSMGKPMATTICSFFYMFVFRFIWVYFIFPLCPDSLTFLYLVWPVGWILSIITLLFVYFPTAKKLRAEAAAGTLERSI